MTKGPDSADIKSEIDNVIKKINDVEEQVRTADDAVKLATKRGLRSRTQLRKTAKELQRPDLSEQERAALVAQHQSCVATLTAAEKDVERLSRKEERLRKKEEQLRKKEEQLREEKLQQDGAAAGLGKESATGVGYSLKATRMMKALHSMQALPGPGEVLKLDVSFLFHPMYDSLFVREWYPQLFDALVCYPKPSKYIVTGTPGIGKSWFFYYLLARLLKSAAPPPFIVWEHMTKPGKAWCYTHETREVVLGERTSFDDVLLNPATWYITDGVPPQLDCLARIVLLTSPKRETFKEMRKEAAEVLYMPLWKLDELLACRSLLYGTVDEALAKDLYWHYGGVARFVLQSPEEKPYKGLDELLEELREAVAGCNTAQMRSSIGSISTGPEASHRLLHIVADETFRLGHLVFASQWVADEFAKKAMSDERQGLISLLSSTSGSVRGSLYEAIMHAVLPKGGSFTVAPIDGETWERQGMEEVLVLGRCTRTEAFKDLQTAATEHVYYRPLSPTFETVDAFERGEKTCDFFQMTVGSSKELDPRKLDSLLNDVQLPVGVTPRLHFVVPEDSYPNFKLKAGGKKNWPPKLQSPAFRMKLHIMKGVYARLQVCTRSLHAGCPMAGGGRRLWL
ncbi:hypothetical protein HXX76_014675 [Chlamydomonas incerta]|uniref:Uncharacterized protein n=1 Tax=Chlamydomonas incerta TaxID=51695 RepID=A0A835SBL3_CHLIN|nr:hypothetical protein HXX76_014675 [Chlamydomonas incerta]|eukprot:KAG2424297.1 hypothetical protein HXX76_014675 [Chlamydomonas incerta]